MATTRTKQDELLEVRKKIGRTIRDTRPDRFKALDKDQIRDHAVEARDSLDQLIRKLGGQRRGRKPTASRRGKQFRVAKRAD